MTALSDVHVLLVDDNDQMRLLVRCLLRAGGLTNITEADTALRAFEMMRERSIDLVIVDWMMQPVDGLAFTRMMRRDNASPNPYIPILMLTAHTEASRVAAARDAGVTGFIKKPISTRLLFDRVASALTDTRMFIRSDDFCGPDRRRGVASGYAGPFRRATDAPATMETIDLDDMRAA
ncbi:MAG TPA: response regulator [Candidatus Binatia bacterium]|nr:response regulator [Candidatus Binatia bacterium]